MGEDGLLLLELFLEVVVPDGKFVVVFVVDEIELVLLLNFVCCCLLVSTNPSVYFNNISPVTPIYKARISKIFPRFLEELEDFR